MEAQVGTGMDSGKFGRGECLPNNLGVGDGPGSSPAPATGRPAGERNVVLLSVRVGVPTSAPDRAGTLRQATRSDVARIQRVRHSVRENVLRSCVITDDEVVEYLERFGRG